MNGIWSGLRKNLISSVRPFPGQIRHVAQLTSPGAIPSKNTPESIKQHSAEMARQRRMLVKRSGLIATKRNMVGWFDEKGQRFGCTVLEIEANEVTHTKTVENDGYWAVQVGAADKYKNVKRSALGHFARAEVSPKTVVGEFQLKDGSGLVPLGTQLKADHFVVGNFVDVQAISKGKGFAGVMKRHGFKGLRASHGVSVSHRHAGSTGANQDPGRVLPGKKMAGRMGGKSVTTHNLEVVHVDADEGYILVKGCVPGPRRSYVKVRDAIKKVYS